MREKEQIRYNGSRGQPFSFSRLTGDQAISVPGTGLFLRSSLERAHLLLEPHRFDDDDDAGDHEQIPLGGVRHAHAAAAAQPLLDVHGQDNQRTNRAPPTHEKQIGVRNHRLVVIGVAVILPDVHLRQSTSGRPEVNR